MTAADDVPFRFGVNADGKYGYIIPGEDGADAVVPFKSSSIQVIAKDQSGNKTIDVTSYDGWKDLTEDNFIISVKRVPFGYNFGSKSGSSIGVSIGGTAGVGSTINIGKKYNADTGIFTATVPAIMVSAYSMNLGASNLLQTHTVNMVYDVYLVWR